MPGPAASPRRRPGNRLRGRDRSATAVGARARAVADRLHSAAIHLLRRLRAADAASGLTAPRLSALSVVVFGGPQTITSLAAAEQVRLPTMTRLVAGAGTGPAAPPPPGPARPPPRRRPGPRPRHPPAPRRPRPTRRATRVTAAAARSRRARFPRTRRDAAGVRAQRPGIIRRGSARSPGTEGKERPT